MTNIVKKPIVKAIDRSQQGNNFHAFVVDIGHVHGGVYAPSNGRVPLDVLEFPPLSGDHKYATVLREVRGV